jgi:antitoxin HicB
MRTRKHPIYWCRFEPDDNDTLLVSCPDFPEVVTYGEDVPHAWMHALGAIEEAIAARISVGQAIPTPSARERVGDETSTFWVKLTTITALKVLLYNLLSEAGMTRAELARQLDWHREQVDRLFRLDHESKASQLREAFGVLGHEVEVEVKPKTEPGDLRRTFG